MSKFRSQSEFREVIDQAFEIMSTDEEMGPRLREAETPQRFEITDLDLVVNITDAPEVRDGQHLRWEWSDGVDWEPEVEMKMSSDVANRYFQGKENIAMAIARRRIKTSGNVKKALNLLPIVKPLFPRYRAMLEKRYPHLVE
jgi:SCP-2 sterol transfer family protein